MRIKEESHTVRNAGREIEIGREREWGCNNFIFAALYGADFIHSAAAG